MNTTRRATLLSLAAIPVAAAVPLLPIETTPKLIKWGWVGRPAISNDGVWEADDVTWLRFIPGDIADECGNIWETHLTRVGCGRIFVTKWQAEKANAFGWSSIGEQHGLTVIDRSEEEYLRRLEERRRTKPRLDNAHYVRVHKWALVDPAYVVRLDLIGLPWEKDVDNVAKWPSTGGVYVEILMRDGSLIESCVDTDIDPRQIVFDIERYHGRCLIGHIEKYKPFGKGGDVRYEAQNLGEVPGIIWDGPQQPRPT